MKRDKLASLFLRLGIAFGFFYAAIASFLSPSSWIGFLPGFLQSESILIAFSVVEIILGLWLLSNWRVFYPAVLSVLLMAGIVVFNLGAFDIVFRDVSILLAALALAVLSYKGR